MEEFHLHMPEADLRQQGARCMIAAFRLPHRSACQRMASGCPIPILIPEWNDLVYRGL